MFFKNQPLLEIIMEQINAETNEILECNLEEFGNVEDSLESVKHHQENFMCTELGCCSIITSTLY